MKKKLNTLFLKIKISCFIVLLLIVLTKIYSFSQYENPFLRSKNPKSNSYSDYARTILIVFDASGSMEDKIRDETKIHIAKRVLEDVLMKAEPDIRIGLRVYGASKPTRDPYYDCSDSKLIVAPGTKNRRLIISEIYKVLPQGFTPITYSLSQAVQDLNPYRGEKSIILISDGLETCGGDPCQLASEIAAAMVDLKIDVVGFGIKDDWIAQQQLKCVALNTQGKYFAADSAQELARGLSESINKSVTGRVITMLEKEIEIKTEETEGYENLPMLQSEMLIFKKRKK